MPDTRHNVRNDSYREACHSSCSNDSTSNLTTSLRSSVMIPSEVIPVDDSLHQFKANYIKTLQLIEENCTISSIRDQDKQHALNAKSLHREQVLGDDILPQNLLPCFHNVNAVESDNDQTQLKDLSLISNELDISNMHDQQSKLKALNIYDKQNLFSTDYASRLNKDQSRFEQTSTERDSDTYMSDYSVVDNKSFAVTDEKSSFTSDDIIQHVKPPIKTLKTSQTLDGSTKNTIHIRSYIVISLICTILMPPVGVFALFNSIQSLQYSNRFSVLFWPELSMHYANKAIVLCKLALVLSMCITLIIFLIWFRLSYIVVVIVRNDTRYT
ncbi:hypothetical protein GJ496_008052 [Pomphorhynchus laevis]|nr:hypothetical protein GJ496_008052 [Pomphorhynchus laevis]